MLYSQMVANLRRTILTAEGRFATVARSEKDPAAVLQLSAQLKLDLAALRLAANGLLFDPAHETAETEALRTALGWVLPMGLQLVRSSRAFAKRSRSELVTDAQLARYSTVVRAFALKIEQLRQVIARL